MMSNAPVPGLLFAPEKAWDGSFAAVTFCHHDGLIKSGFLREEPVYFAASVAQQQGGDLISGGVKTVVAENPVQDKGLFLGSSLPIQKELVIVGSQTVVKGLGDIHIIFPFKKGAFAYILSSNEGKVNRDSTAMRMQKKKSLGSPSQAAQHKYHIIDPLLLSIRILSDF